jgi:hypothetical protein
MLDGPRPAKDALEAELKLASGVSGNHLWSERGLKGRAPPIPPTTHGRAEGENFQVYGVRKVW